MKYKKYPSYKDSGVAWLGEIPDNWQSLKIKNICTFDKGYGLSKKELSSQGIYQCLLYGELFTRYKYDNTIKTVISRTNYNNAKVSKGNEILIPSSTTTTGVDLSNAKYLPHSDILLGGDIIVLVPRKNNYNFEYVSYFLTHVNYAEFARESKGVTIVHIYSSAIREMPIFLPPILEQQQIANFLDKATAKIDTLIEKQTKQIELLKEKRQAVISHAVTKGINPNVKLKDSGIEWLGEIPEHWTVLKIKYYGKYKSGDFISADYIELEGTYPVMGGNGFRGYTEAYNLNGKYVLIGRQGALCGNINYSNGKTWATEHAIVVYQRESICTEWLGQILTIMNLNQYSVSAAQPGLAVENIINLKSILPSLQEQQQIANYIVNKISKIDTLIEKSKKSIELLKEKRTALISACVTGKIDVRELV